jgi:hypothetical protein
MDKVYICAIKILGFPFAVMTEEEAEQWRKENPEVNYYHQVPVKQIEIPQP